MVSKEAALTWLEELQNAHASAALLAADLRPDAPDLAAARARCESLLQHLDNAVASVAVAASRAKDPPVSELRDDDDQDWNGPSFRYSPRD